MAWLVEDRRAALVAAGEPLLTEEMKSYLRDNYFPRYPTKRAVLLPALHHVQHTYGHIPVQALDEIAVFLELAPSEVIDTATFYEEYWLKPKGKYLLQVCRSLSCEICASGELTRAIQDMLKIDVGQTTKDGRFTLVELECLGSCGTAPAALVNEVLHEELTPAKLLKVIQSLPEDPHDYHDPTIDWETHDNSPDDALEEGGDTMVIIGAILTLVVFIVLLWIARRVLNAATSVKPPPPVDPLEGLRQLRDAGELTIQEYEEQRRRLIERARRGQTTG